jgi:hypothetical protein
MSGRVGSQAVDSADGRDATYHLALTVGGAGHGGGCASGDDLVCGEKEKERRGGMQAAPSSMGVRRERGGAVCE